MPRAGLREEKRAPGYKAPVPARPSLAHSGKRAPNGPTGQARRAARAASGEARQAVGTASGEAGRAERKPAFRRLARFGIGARAVIYVLLAFMAADIALTHHSPSTPSSTGALAEIARQPAGRPVLALLAIGFLSYAMWRVVQVLAPESASGQGAEQPGSGEGGQLPAAPCRSVPRWRGRLGKPAHEARNTFQRVGWGAVAVVYFGLCGRAVALAMSSSDSSGGGASSHPQPLVATVLRWPGGPGWVGLVGTGIGVAGVAMLIWGCVHDYSKTLDTSHLRGAGQLAAKTTGIVGEATRGVLVALIAAYLLVAAINDNPSQAKSLGGALYSFDHLAAGPVLLLAAAAGLACFAAFSVVEALYRRV